MTEAVYADLRAKQARISQSLSTLQQQHRQACLNRVDVLQGELNNLSKLDSRLNPSSCDKFAVDINEFRGKMKGMYTSIFQGSK